MKDKFLFPIFIIVLSVLVGCVQQAVAIADPVKKNNIQPEMAEQLNNEGILLVDAFCSPDRIRTAVAQVSWRASVEEAEIQELDVTIFKTGFEKDVYGSLSPLKPDSRLRLTDSAQEQEATLGGIIRLEVTGADYDRENNLVILEISDLEPGLNYFWRLRVDGETISKPVVIEAPVCVADEAEGE